MPSSSEEFGPYVVFEQIGLGGMATVHRAQTQGIAGFSKQVALKRMLPNVATDAKLVQSFIREARLASHLRHVNVAQTYDLGKVGETYFIAMELVPGHNLHEILKHCAKGRRMMPLSIALNIVSQIADALDYAHNLCDESGSPLGIIHRDVSPTNVIVSEGGVAKLIDFGVAKATGGGLETQSGLVKGKFSYFAPECLTGHADARTDLFALGVIAHEMLTNRLLFQGRDDVETVKRVQRMPIVPPSRTNPQVPPEIEYVIMKALERDPAKRWQHVTAMRQALTAETQRLGLVAHNGQVVEWIDEVFGRTTRDELDEPTTNPMASDWNSPTNALTRNERPPSRASAPELDEATRLLKPPPLDHQETALHRRATSPNQPQVVQPAVSTPLGAEDTPVRIAAPIAHSVVSKAQTRVEERHPRAGNFLLGLLVLIAACGAAAVVYFALPYLT